MDVPLNVLKFTSLGVPTNREEISISELLADIWNLLKDMDEG